MQLDMCYRLPSAERKCSKSLPGGLPPSSCSGRWPPGTVSEGHRCTLIRRHTLVPLVWGPPGTDRLEGDQELGASNTCLASNRFLPHVFASLSVVAAPNFPVVHFLFAFLDFQTLFLSNILSLTFSTRFLHLNHISPDWVLNNFLSFIFWFKFNDCSPS